MMQRAQQEARQSRQRTSSFTGTFMKELKEGFKDADDKIKKDR